ncbi:MAG: hypothetical protein RBS34_02780 [Desulfofustis sp.]|jgi:hypothetical protein|nr:hypothetical protein [Desulfofustis sp.]
MIVDFSAVFLGQIPARQGRHRLAGTVTVDGQPARRNIMVVDRRTMTYVGGTTSDPVTGAWEIVGLVEYPERELLVLALDTTGHYNAEVADYITQVATVEP